MKSTSGRSKTREISVFANMTRRGGGQYPPEDANAILMGMQPTVPFRFESRIRFADTDASGRIHYTAIFRHFEAAETELMRAVGITYGSGNVNFPRVHVECDFRVPLRHDDVIVVEVCLTKLGRSSARFEFQTFRSGELTANGAVVVVCTDIHSGRAVPIPAELRAKLEPALCVAGPQSGTGGA